jgi:sugar phosphate isomerase/epimerase
MESQSVIDLRLLDEIADEILKHGYTGLPGALRSYIKTKRAQKVASLLESQALGIINLKIKLNESERTLKAEIDGLRDTIENLTNDLDKYLGIG